MTRKHYQWLALAVLIVAPVLTGLLGGVLPDRELDHPVDLSRPEAKPQSEPAAIIRTDLQPPAPTTQPPALSADGAGLDVSPTLDTNGMAVTGMEIGSDEAIAATQPAMPMGEPAAPVQSQ